MSEVRSLGYVVVSTGDLDAWEAFATGLLGLQVSERTADRLLLRNDRYWCRLRVELGSAEGVKEEIHAIRSRRGQHHPLVQKLMAAAAAGTHR